MEVRTAAEQLLFTTVRIEVDVPGGTATGTAFIFTYDWDDKQAHFLVTNKHVVDDAERGRFFFTLMDEDHKPLIGQRYNCGFNNFRLAWHYHPDPNVDIAVMPMVPILTQIHDAGYRVFFKSVTDDLVPAQDQATDLDAVEDVMFIGYPDGIYDVKHLMPIVRRGITATPFEIDYNGEPKFLIDASVFPGSSGSPVFSLRPAGSRTAAGLYVSLLCIFWGLLPKSSQRKNGVKLILNQSPRSGFP
jgi:S1-C subfamily serine protease